MFSKLFATFATLAFVATAAAGEGKTEFFYKPGADKNSASAKLKSTSYKTEPAGNVTGSGMIFGFDFWHGLSDDMAVGVDTDFGTDEYTVTGSTTKPKDTGMGDLNAHFLAASGMGSWSLFYGGDLGLSFSAKKTVSTTQDGSRNSGGHSISPLVGIHYPATDAVAVGAKFMYTMKMERTSQATTAGVTTDTKTTGGDSWTLPIFGEYNFGDGIVGLWYAMGSSGATKTAVGTATAAEATKGGAISGLGLNASYNFGPELTGLLEYSSWSMADKSAAAGAVEVKTLLTSLNVGARYSF